MQLAYFRIIIPWNISESRPYLRISDRVANFKRAKQSGRVLTIIILGGLEWATWLLVAVESPLAVNFHTLYDDQKGVPVEPCNISGN